MPGPSDRVVVDPDRMETLIAALVEVEQVLHAQSRALTRTLADAALPTGPAARLGALADEAGAETASLRQRLVLARGLDRGLTAGRPSRTGPAADAPASAGTGVGPSGRLVPRGGPDVSGTAAQSRAAGRGWADALLGRGGQSLASPADALTVLRSRRDDPAFVQGFHDALGPDGLARLLYRVTGLSPAPLSRRPADPLGLTRPEAERILADSLAAYSRLRPLNDAWWGRFNTRGRADAAETVLLTPLLKVAAFDDRLLARLGRMTFGPGDPGLDSSPAAAPRPAPGGPSRTRDVGLFRADTRSGPAAGDRLTVAGYRVALLDAISRDAGLAAQFAADRIGTVLHTSALLSLPLPVNVRTERPVDQAWTRLIAAAGSTAARRADPDASARFVAQLARSMRAAGEPPLSAQLRAALIPTLRTYADTMYGTVTAVVPAPPADPRHPSPEAIPATDWAALLRAALRGGALADQLARDCAAYGMRLDAGVAAATRGWNSGPGGYPTSPRALGYLRSAAAQAFFAAALTDAADAVRQDHTTAVAEHRRRQAVVLDLLGEVAKAIDPTNPTGTFIHLGVGVTVEMIEAWVRARPDPRPGAETLAVLRQLREAERMQPGWASSYEASARQLWARRDADPLRPVTVTTAGGARRTYTGDPHHDGFITTPEQDFLDASGAPRPVAAMTPIQRRAYAAWLGSPALVANNDRITMFEPTRRQEVPDHD